MATIDELRRQQQKQAADKGTRDATGKKVTDSGFDVGTVKVNENYLQRLASGNDISGKELRGGTEVSTSTGTSDSGSSSGTLGDIQRQRTINSLKATRDKALGTLSRNEAEIAPAYRGQVGQARSESAITGRVFNDFLAERGLQSSGVAAQGELNRSAGLQTQIGTIRENQAGALSDIALQKAQARTDYSLGEQNADLTNQEYGLNQQLSAQQAASARALQIEDLQLSAQIKEAQAVNDFGREQILVDAKNQNAIKLANLKSASDAAQIRLTASLRPASTPKTKEPTPAEQIAQLQQNTATILSQYGVSSALDFLEQNKLPMVADFGEEQAMLIYDDLVERTTKGGMGDLVENFYKNKVPLAFPEV